VAEFAGVAKPAAGIAAPTDALSFAEPAHLKFATTDQGCAFGTMAPKMIQPDISSAQFFDCSSLHIAPTWCVPLLANA
jgi:hypothetical protein